MFAGLFQAVPELNLLAKNTASLRFNSDWEHREVCTPHLPGMMKSLGSSLLPRRKLKRKHVRFFAMAGRTAGLDQGAVGAHQCLDAVGHISAYICLSCLTPAPRSLAPGHPQPKLLARAPG